MPQPSIRNVDLASLALGAALPGVAGLAALLALDAVAAGPAAAALALVLATAIAVAWPPVRDLAAVRDLLDRLGDDEAAEDGRALRAARRTPVGAGLSRALIEARRRVHRAQLALEARATEAETVIDAVPEPLLVLDGDRRIAHANLAAEQLFEGEIVGRDLVEVLRHPGVLEGVVEVLSGGPALTIDFELSVPIERQLRARVAPLPTAGETGDAAVLALEDLTAIRRAEQMRQDFVANVSHELRTPLASLVGFIETLEGPARDDAPARARFLAIMREQAQRMTRLVDDLMSLSRIEMDEHIRPSSPVRLAGVLESVASSLQPVAAERSVAIELHCPPNLPPVPGDADQLAQVFRNLIENAIKYGPEAGTVRIEVREDAAGRAVDIAVVDTGPGIPREHIPRLTERFYRVDAARSRRLGGTGLGLAIVKHIVNRHRGTLRIESEVGRGSRFTIGLPLS